MKISGVLMKISGKGIKGIFIKKMHILKMYLIELICSCFL